LYDIISVSIPGYSFVIFSDAQNERCGECLTKLKNFFTYNEPPKLLMLEYPYTITKTSYKIRIKVNNTNTFLYLKELYIMEKIILYLNLYIIKDAKYGSMIELQLEAKIL
jgi:hypothetical protein